MLSPNPTAEEVTRYTGWLTDAENSYQRLMTGAQEVSVDYMGEKVVYTAPNANRLLAWINQLRAAIGKGKSVNPGFAIKPVVFGAKRGTQGLF